MRTSLSRSRLLPTAVGGLSAVALAGLFLLPACTRPTVGFCSLDEECESGQYCALPDHACTQATILRGVFSGGQMLPPTASIADGEFKMVIGADGASGAYTLSHAVTGATKAELYLGNLGTTGALVRSLTLDPSGTLQLDPDTVRALKAGNYYLQISSSAFPSGEVRAQLFSDDPLDNQTTVKLHGSLAGVQSAPPNNSPAVGPADITFNGADGSVSYSYSYKNLQGSISGLHVHRGGFNVNGPHTFDLPLIPDLSSSGVLSSADLQTQLTDPLLYRAQRHYWQILLRSGMTYLNIHSSTFVKGEIRAQLLPSAAVPFNVALANTMPAGAQGQAQFYLSADGTSLAFRLTHNVTNPTSAIIFSGSGASRTMYNCTALAASGGGNNSQGYCLLQTTASTVVLESVSLRAGLYTLAITSAQNPMGEISGPLVVPAS